MLVVIVCRLSLYETHEPTSTIRARVTTHVIDRRDGVCHLHRSSHLLISILLRRERTSPQFPLPIGRADREAARVCILGRKLIYTGKPASALL